jgi:HEAT repeat protein
LKVRLASAARRVAPEKLDLMTGELNGFFQQVVPQWKIELWPHYLTTVQVAGVGQLGERVAIALAELLLDQNSWVRGHAAWALGELRHARAGRIAPWCVTG